MMKKLNKKAFTLIELLVVIAVVGILVLLGAPKFTGYTQKAELTRIQHDIKVMEQEVGTVLSTDDDFNKWEDNNKDLNQLIQEGKLFEKEGVVKPEEFNIDETYKVIPEKHKDKINTKLKGTFYANSGGKVYYEHLKPLSGIPTEPGEPEEEQVLEGPIPIATAEELNNVRNATIETYGKGTQWEGLYEGGLDKQYFQVADVDLSEYSEEGWNPIGTLVESESESEMLSASFTGTYDGGNYVITGLEVKGEGENNQGLFGFIAGATISNVGLIENKVTGTNDVGGLVGYAFSSTIENSYSTGPVEGSGHSVDRLGIGVGGLVGSAAYSDIENSYTTGEVKGSWNVGGLVGSTWDSTIEDSYATGSIIGARDSVGGLVGGTNESTIKDSYAKGSVEGRNNVGGLVGVDYKETKISNSYAIGSVTGTEYDVGGLVGKAEKKTEISKSYATGSVEGSSRVGGLVGSASDNTEISNSYAIGSVTGKAYNAGGLVGYAFSSTKITNSYATGEVKGTWIAGGLVGSANSTATISNSYATGAVTGTRNLGGLVGQTTSNNINNSYWDTDTAGLSSSAGGEGKTTKEMKKQATYSGWNFEETWKIDEGSDYPKLR